MQTAGRIKLKYDECSHDDRPTSIVVDVIGIGAGVVDRLREMDLPVRALNVSEMPAVRQKFHRLRDEMYWKGREWFEGMDVECADMEVGAELADVLYGYTSRRADQGRAQGGHQGAAGTIPRHWRGAAAVADGGLPADRCGERRQIPQGTSTHTRERMGSMKNGTKVDVQSLADLPECRMFTNMQETLIFSSVGKLSAALDRLKKNATVYAVDMTARVHVSDIEDMREEIRALTLICMEALGNKDIVE
jgi:hypothetical protein